MTNGFDELLQRSRQQFDGLFGGAGTGRTEGSDALSVAGPVAAPAGPLDPVSSPATHTLNQRFGDDWHYEILDQSMDGEDVVVQCRLSIPGQGVAVTASGRASYAMGRRIEGRVGDIPFSTDIGDASSADADNAAWQAAAERALAGCLSQIGR